MYMKKLLPLFIFLLGFTYSAGQDLYLIKLKPKENTSTYITNPLQMLSQRALDRRVKYTIPLDDKDIPISSSRIQQIKQKSLNYIGHSKWLNTVMIETSEIAVINELKSLNFVESVTSMVQNSSGAPRAEKVSKWKESFQNKTNFDYGYSNEFIQQINVKPLHDNNIRGQGVYIGVIDAGFPGVNTMSVFEKLRTENRIFDTYDFVENKTNVYRADSHGTNVLSTMAGEIDGTYIGTAPKAIYTLYRSEDADIETPKELMYWVQAAERADSVGVDIINTSLGYTEFDDSRYDFTYQNMDGKTTLISQGAEIAGNKGIFVVVAAGNEGGDSWKMISAPADVENVFTVGANDSNKNPAYFSSYGPNALGVIKPNVSALGLDILVYYPNNSLYYSAGTSFSSPVTAGAVALMIQQFPKVSHTVLKDKIQKTGHLYSSPSKQLGYGVPDYYKASQDLLAVNDLNLNKLIQVYPNPFKNSINIQSQKEIKIIEIYSLIGEKIISVDNQNRIMTDNLKTGVYIIKVTDKEGKIFSEKILKL